MPDRLHDGVPKLARVPRVPVWLARGQPTGIRLSFFQSDQEQFGRIACRLIASRSGWWRNDPIAQCGDDFQRLQGGVAVVLLFDVAQCGIRDQAGIRFGRVVALRSILPTVGDALLRPDFMSMLGQLLGECQNPRRQGDVRRIGRSRFVGHEVVPENRVEVPGRPSQALSFTPQRRIRDRVAGDRVSGDRL